MSFHRIATAAPAAGLVFACVGTAPAQQDHATPEEVVQRVQQAAQDIAKRGQTALATYGSKNDTSVWKDSYVTVVSCEGGAAVGVAHPIRPELKGKPLAGTLTNLPQIYLTARGPGAISPGWKHATFAASGGRRRRSYAGGPCSWSSGRA